ncbi:MAG: FAD-dependent oxidoreductase [Mycoplasmataceae bacterium]|nr:FAD-dependent oxidoreductase [Mycoplasmataceae bacterium]
MKKERANIAIIGGGVIGIIIAEYFLNRGIKDVYIVEKNTKILRETSSHNSGLIHGGFDATPGTLKAKFNVEGRHIFERDYFKEGMPFDWKKISSIILAFNSEDIKELDKLYDQGIANGLEPSEMRILEREEILAIDPGLNPDVLKAFICYSSTVIDPVGFGLYLYKRALKHNLHVLLNTKIKKIVQRNGNFILETNNEIIIEADFVINAAGVWAEHIAKMVEENPDFKIDTRRGQYRILDPSQAHKVGDNVYFLTPSKHGKGVIVAKMFSGQVLVGPTAEDGVPLKDIQLTTPKSLELVKKIGNYIFPSLDMDRTEETFAGSRAINVTNRDFHIAMSNSAPNFLHVAGMQSPGLSSAPAIAKYVFELHSKYKI